MNEQYAAILDATCCGEDLPVSFLRVLFFRALRNSDLAEVSDSIPDPTHGFEKIIGRTTFDLVFEVSA